MTTKYTETVTVKREVPRHIAELVDFVKTFPHIENEYTDAELIRRAREFYDRLHGDDCD